MGPVQRPRVKLSDFGLAKSFRDNAGFAGLTHQGDIGGSVGFISPDHIRDFREVKEPADIYSAGGHPLLPADRQYPFLGFDPRRADAYEMILEHPPGPPPGLPPRRPRGPRAGPAKALEKQPARPLEVGRGDGRGPAAVLAAPLGLSAAPDAARGGCDRAVGGIRASRLVVEAVASV